MNWSVRPWTEYGNSMADVLCWRSRPPQRYAAKTLASSSTDSATGTVRSISYTAPASVTRSRAVWVRASDLVWNTVPSGLGVPSFSPPTGEYRGWASHCIQSQAARIFHDRPTLDATSRYRNSARASGLRAEDSSALFTAVGISGW